MHMRLINRTAKLRLVSNTEASTGHTGKYSEAIITMQVFQRISCFSSRGPVRCRTDCVLQPVPRFSLWDCRHCICFPLVNPNVLFLLSRAMDPIPDKISAPEATVHFHGSRKEISYCSMTQMRSFCAGSGGGAKIPRGPGGDTYFQIHTSPQRYLVPADLKRLVLRRYSVIP